MFRWKRRAVVAQLPTIATVEVLRLLISKGLIEVEEAAACLRGIANNVVAHGYTCGLGEAGRPIAEALIARALEMERAPPREPVIPFYESRSGLLKSDKSLLTKQPEVARAAEQPSRASQ